MFYLKCEKKFQDRVEKSHTLSSDAYLFFYTKKKFQIEIDDKQTKSLTQTTAPYVSFLRLFQNAAAAVPTFYKLCDAIVPFFRQMGITYL